VTLINRLSVVFVIVLAATILEEKVSLQAAVGIVLVTIGAIIIALAGWHNYLACSIKAIRLVCSK
jgi:transporter family protein